MTTNNNRSILITGANGFVGKNLIRYLHQQNKDYRLISATRTRDDVSLANKNIVCGEINGDTNWSDKLKNIDVIIHLAARVHVMNDSADDPLSEFREVNLHGTIKLAQEAVKAGVKRFIYISSIKVNGEQTFSRAFTADDLPVPHDPYAVSKFEAEQALMKIKALEIVIIRPPLVYGPGMKGNLLRLKKLIELKLPLPLAGINNKRSLVSVENFSSLIECCISHPDAAGEIFLVSDGEDISTSELIQILAKTLNKKIVLFPVPAFLIRYGAKIVGLQAEYQRLFNSLQIDLKKNNTILNWTAKSSTTELMRPNLWKEL